MKVYLIIDNTAGNIIKLANEQGLIDYANSAHFVEKDLSKPIDESQMCYACDDVGGAKSILSSDMFYVEELDFDNNMCIHDLSFLLEDKKVVA